MGFFWTLVVLVILLALAWRYLGAYMVAVFDGLRLGARGLPFYSLVFHCRPIGGELRPHPLEARDVGWFAEDALPEPLAGGGLWRQLAFRAIRGEVFDVVFDSPRPSTWRT